MKRFLGFALSAILLCACNEQNAKENAAKNSPAEISQNETSKNAVIYYSQTGTTKKVAEEFSKQLSAKIFELKMVTPYPSTYDSTIAAVKRERESKTHPTLQNAKLNLTSFDTLYIGYPIMFGTFAPPIYTFLDSNDLSGKAIVPFCTYGSGGRLASAHEIQEIETNANVLIAFGISHKRANNSAVNVADEIKNFIDKVRTGAKEEILVGAYSEERALTQDDSAAFIAATKDYAYLNLKPLAVSSQVVAGTNYLFKCTMQAFGAPETLVSVKIFAPLPNQGEPQFIEMMKN